MVLIINSCLLQIVAVGLRFIGWRDIAVTDFFAGNFINANIRYFIVY